MGSSSNGWQYNGSAAPQTITTTTNTLTLTAPACTTTLQNVSAAANIGSTGYNAGASTVSAVNPAFTINGANGICTTPVSYSINTLPCSATVTWSASPSGLVSISPTTGATTTLTRIANGTVTLKATVSNTCVSGNVEVTKSIIIYNSAPYIYLFPGEGFISGSMPPSTPYPNTVCNLASTNVDVGVDGASGVTWSKYSPSGYNVSWSQSGNNLNFYFFDPIQQAVFKVSSTNGCGTTTEYFGFQSSDCSGGGGGCSLVSYEVSPNPASTYVTVIPDIPPPCDAISSSNTATAVAGQSFSSNNSATGKVSSAGVADAKSAVKPAPVIKAIKVYNGQGMLVKTFNYSTAIQQARIDISNLTAGIYFVEIFNGDTIARKKIIIWK